MKIDKHLEFNKAKYEKQSRTAVAASKAKQKSVARASASPAQKRNNTT